MDLNYGRSGGSLRDALNEAYPMTGLGEYGAMFPPRGMTAPPASGDPTPSPPVPLPPQRPQMPVPLPAGGVTMPPNYPAAQQLYRGLAQGPAAPGNYVQRLGLTGY